jgi:hypothetical protein
VRAKPKNWRGLVESVRHVNHPEIDTTDKCILNCLAGQGSDKGVGCRPGNAALMNVASLKWSQTHERLKKLIRLKLIQRTKVGDGRKNASEYDICYWHPAYPDFSPNGRERYSDGGPENGNHPVKPDSKSKNHPDAPDGLEQNHPASHEKPSGSEAETIRSETETIRPIDRMTSQTHPKHNPTPSPPEKAPNGALARGGEVAFNYQDLPEEMQYTPSGKRKKRWEELIAKHGPDVMKRAVRRWYDIRDTRGLKDSWGFFLNECGPCVQWAIKEATEERRRNDPAQKARDEKLQRDFETRAGGVLGTDEEIRKGLEKREREKAQPPITLADLD